MKLQQLRILASVAKYGSVTAAAAELHLSQPAASIRLRRLEEEYGLTLFQRKRDGMALTREGREFLDHVRPVLSSLRALDAKYKPHARGSNGTCGSRDIVAVGSNRTLLDSVFSDALSRFRERWGPDPQVVLEISSSYALEKRVSQLQLDVALISNPRGLANCEYETFHEVNYDVVAVVATTSTLSRRPSMSLQELLNQPLIVLHETILADELKRRGYTLKSALQCRSPEDARLAISQRLGVGLLLKSWVESEIAGNKMSAIDVPELDHLTCQSYIAWNRDRVLNDHAQRLIQTLRDTIRQP